MNISKTYNEISIKQITESDITIEFVNQLRLEFPKDEDNPEWEIEKVLNFVSDDKNLLLIGYYNNEIASFLYGHVLDRFDDQKQFFIYELGTNDKYQRKGIMKAIIETLLLELKRCDFDEAWVLTNKSNIPATSLYASTGAITESSDEVMYVYNLKKDTSSV
jgi:ribosomal protein S18 acetylase RimI-like enzyme